MLDPPHDLALVDAPAQRSRIFAARELWALVGITVAAAALRFVDLGSQSLWLDEWLTHNDTLRSLHGVASTLVHTEAHPPLYFGLVWGWAKIFGTDELGLRSLSAVVGTATVPLAYAAARTRLSGRVALLAAALVAVNPFSVWYSQEARPYALLEALCVLSLLCLIRAVDTGRRSWLWGWAAASALALMTHFFAGFLLVGEVIWLRWRRRGREVYAAIGAVGIAGVLMLALVARGDTSEVAWVHASAPLGTRVALLPVQLLTGLYLNWDAATDTALRFVCAAVLCALALALAVASRRERMRALPFLVAAAAIILLPLAVAVVKPSSDYFLPRYLIAALVPLLILVAVGLASRRAGLLGGLVLVAVLLSMTISIAARPELQRPDWRGAANAMGPATAERAVITNVNVQGRPLTYYARGLASVYDGGTAMFAGDPPVKQRTSVTASQVVYITPAVFGGRAGRVPPSPGFRLTARRTVHGFLVLTYTAPSAHRFTAGELAATATGVYGYRLGAVDAPSVYSQRPG